MKHLLWQCDTYPECLLWASSLWVERTWWGFSALCLLTSSSSSNLIRCVQIVSNLIRCCHTRQHDQLPHHSLPIWSGICTYPEIYSTSSSFSCNSIRCVPILNTMLTYLIFFIKFDQVCVNTQQFAQLPHHPHWIGTGVCRYTWTWSSTHGSYPVW